MKRSSLPHNLVVAGCILLVTATLVGGCSTPTPEMSAQLSAEDRVVETTVAEEVVKVEKEVTKIVAGTPVVENMVFARAYESAGNQNVWTSSTLGDADTSSPLPVPYRADRMIIKNAELSLRVAETDPAIDQVTQIAIDAFGYILTARTWYENDYKYATVTMGVPVDEFENAVRRLRALALKVLDEHASGSDVTDQYVDLESQLRNLEATEARIRTFLEKAQTVEEALLVNQRLSDITAQIEHIKGQMNYLKDRAAYSTITVHLSPEVPTPTPSPTPTVTPTSTPTPTPTPVAWRPHRTFERSTTVLGTIARTLGDALIWVVVVVGPFALALALFIWLGVRLRRVWRKPQ